MSCGSKHMPRNLHFASISICWLSISVNCYLATKAIIASESGRGRDANRPAHKLLTDLAEIYERRTGRKITRGNSGIVPGVKTTPFGRFVEAVNARIPDGFKLPDIDNLIRQHARPGG
jgi:hypothetical protein